MKEFSGRTLQDALEAASKETNLETSAINYKIIEEKKGLFSRKTTIEVYFIEDIVEYGENYLTNLISSLGLEVEIVTNVEDTIIKMLLNTSHNSILIGKNGRTLQALNELVRVAISSNFRRRYRILLDINSYKDEKYEKLIQTAKRAAKEVLRTKINVTLDPMTSDERRVIHNALSEFKNIKTESSGSGYQRQITISYIGN